MPYLFMALGGYLATVGWRGNAEEFFAQVKDSKQFVLWGAALGILFLLYENNTTRPIAVPFGGLALLALILKSEPTIAKQLKSVNAGLQPAKQSNSLLRGFGP